MRSFLMCRAWLLLFVCAVECSCGGGSSSPKSPPLTISTTSLPSGMMSFTYDQTVISQGGTAPFTWSVSSGSLPHNVTLASSSTGSVVLSGTPDTVAEATFGIQVKDLQGKSASETYSITIAATGSATLQATNEQAPAGIVEIRGLSAGPFNPAAWQQNQLNWVPDVRSPLLAPLSGGGQNIYSPWPLEQANGWLLFYGGWDGSATPNNRVYDVSTPDFLSFGSRALVIDHGEFQHVNNVNVRQLPDGSLHMICTVLKDGNSLDKPAYFSSPDGTTWNGAAQPYSAQLSDVVSIPNDANYAGWDYNGGNVLLWDNNDWVLYYSVGIYGAIGRVYRATSSGPPVFSGNWSSTGYPTVCRQHREIPGRRDRLVRDVAVPGRSRIRRHSITCLVVQHLE
jgi:hypothetical protein